MGREVRCGDTIRLLVARPASSPARQATTSFLEHLGDLGIVRVHSCVCKCHAIRQMMGRSAFRTNTRMSASIQYSSMKQPERLQYALLSSPSLPSCDG